MARRIEFLGWLLMKHIIKVKSFLQNFKIEAVVIICYVIFNILKKTCLSKVNFNFSLDKYFTQDRLDGIATFFSITIGIYIAVITILAMSVIGISKDLLQKKLDKPLLNIVVAGLVEDIISVALAIFIPLNAISSKILLIFIITSIVSFTKFIILLLEIFKVNMDKMAKTIDDDDNYKDNMLTYAEGIFNYCRKSEDKLVEKDKKSST